MWKQLSRHSSGKNAVLGQYHGFGNEYATTLSFLPKEDQEFEN